MLGWLKMAVSKIERLLGIIFLLINRDKMTAKELGDYFSVSVKTIYRDIETLSLAHIPITSYAGINGGYGIMKNYVIDKNMFSYEEIISALSVIGSISSFFNDPSLSVVAEKIQSLIDIDKKGDIIKLSKEMVFDLSSWGDSEPTKRKINIIRNAINTHNLLSFNYTNRNGESINRTVEPINILFKERAWYMKGYCRLKSDVRTFRLTRISNLTTSTETYEPDESKYDIGKVINHKINNDDKYVNVLMKVSPDARVQMEDYVDADRVYEENGILYAKFCYPDEEYLYNTLLGFGDKIEIIEPDYIKDILKERAKRVYELYYYKSQSSNREMKNK
jgi:predicted DNA-binding transcriptional regulator YafY